MNRFQLLQWKHAINLEAKGLRHSSGRSVNAHAARALGMEGRPTRKTVLKEIDRFLDLIDRGEVEDSGPAVIFAGGK